MMKQYVDEALLAEPLTKGEAYLLISKLKRMSMWALSATVKQVQGDTSGLQDSLSQFQTVSAELDTALFQMVGHTEKADDE